MKIILKKNVETKGRAGEVIEVADGYARNYLIPKGYAIPATENNLQLVEKIKDEEEARLAKERKETEMIMKQVEKTTLNFQRLADEKGHLYGSVDENDIVDALEEKDLSISKSNVQMDNHLKEIGQHKVVIKLKENIEGKLTVIIEKEEKEEE